MFESRRKFFATLFGALLAIAGLASFNAQSAPAKDPVPRLEGSLASVNVPGRRVSVRLQNGTTKSLAIPTTAKVERNGVTASLSAFKVGDRVQARFAADGVTVVKFEGVGP